MSQKTVSYIKNVIANLLENDTASNKLRYGQYMKTGMNCKFT